MQYHSTEMAPCAPIAPRRIYRIRRNVPTAPIPRDIVKRILRDAVLDMWLLDGSRSGCTIASCLDEAETLVSRLDESTLDDIASGAIPAASVASAIADSATTH